MTDYVLDAPKCHYCNDTGMVACRSRDGQYAFAGAVPDDAKGYFDTDCWYCDSGPPPTPLRSSCDICDATDRPTAAVTAYGIETNACDKCRGVEESE